MQGHGVAPRRWNTAVRSGTVGSANTAGIRPPLVAPTITNGLAGTVRYYIARMDVTKPGACYNAPPAVTIASPPSPPTGFRAAQASSYLSQGSVGEIIVTDGGKHYPSPPAVTLSATHGSGAVLVANLDGTPPNPTGLHHWEIVEGPPFADDAEVDPIYRAQWYAWRPTTFDIEGSSGSVTDTFYTYGFDCVPPPITLTPRVLTQTYTITGAGSGTGCKIRVGFFGASFWTWRTTPCQVSWTAAWGVSGITLVSAGTGYSENTIVRVTIPSGTAGRNLVLEGCTPGNARNTTTPRFKVSSVTITSGGSGYNVAPEIKLASTTGFGAYAESTVTNGVITGVALESGGGGYKTVPTVTAVSGGAEAFAIARPHLRGKYQCYYRYVDDTPESLGGPIPSNLSPVTEFDAGTGMTRLSWSWTAPTSETGRPLTTELWRTTSNQATTLYRVTTSASTTFTDDLTDEELRNPNRAGYAAMPIVMPNGELNAMRFTMPPNNKAVVVRFQDRMWYGVDTAGTDPVTGAALPATEANSIYFSEVDEPESVPSVNEFVLQQNARDGDSISALIPHGTSLIIMQSRRSYALSYARKPLVDGAVIPLAYRGCLNQRCWDTSGGILYVMDRRGVYSLTPSGDVEDLSAPIADIFRSEIDVANTTWNFLVIDPSTKILRAFVALAGEGSASYPTCALCYSIDAKTWWKERYPRQICSAAPIPMPDGTTGIGIASAGFNYVLGASPYDESRGTIVSVTLTNKGTGYRTPPTVTVTGGSGAVLQAVVDGSGGIGGIWIISGGYGFTTATISIGPPNDPTVNGAVNATATATIGANELSTFVPFRHRTGNFEFPTDASKNGDVDTPRGVAITYKPQPATCDIAMRMYYNSSPHPRHNVVPRDRGSGFRNTVPDGAARLDLGELTTKTGYDSGVARSVFSGKTMQDMRGGDRHVSVEVIGATRTPEPITIYRLDVEGVVGGD